jgi:hypothetical protein
MTGYALVFLLLLFQVTSPVVAEPRSTTSAAPPGVSQAACDRMKARGVLASDAPVSCEKLAIVRFSYVDFDGRSHDDGQIMVMTAVSDYVKSIFDALYARRFPIARAVLMDHYLGDDIAAMKDNNTSAFNHRPVTGGKLPSLHAYGLAIDLNPLQNPFVQIQADGNAIFSPPSGTKYANRLSPRPGKTARAGMAEEVVDLFARNGFLIWGGDWDAPIDYQHFQVDRKTAERLAALPVAQARTMFGDHVRRYRNCLKERHAKSNPDARIICIEKQRE